MLAALQPLVTALVAAAVAIIASATPWIISWMKSYFSMREVAMMRLAVTDAASREAAMLVSAVPDVRLVKIGDQALINLANDLIAHYPDYTDKLGIELYRAQNLILGEAHKIFNMGLVPVTAAPANAVSVTTSAVTSPVETPK